MTRRELLWRVGHAGGYSAAFVAMRSLGLLAEGQREPVSLDFPADTGRGTRVAILGAGVAGLVAAYELRKLGSTAPCSRPGTGPGDATGRFDAATRRALLPLDDRICFAGDHCSHVPTWQEGAALSAQRAARMIVTHVREVGGSVAAR